MIDYDIEINENGMIVHGPFSENSVPISMPLENPNEKTYAYLFLHKADIERGIDYLRCISIDKSQVINEALFIAGLNNCIKCFQQSGARGHLYQDRVFKNNKEMKKCFEYFLNLRNKHYVHDNNGMTQATAFLIVSNKDDEFWGGPASVVWNRAKIDYYNDGKILQDIMLFIRDYICKEIDRINELILADYEKYTKEELLNFPPPRIKRASSENPSCNR